MRFCLPGYLFDGTLYSSGGGWFLRADPKCDFTFPRPALRWSLTARTTERLTTGVYRIAKWEPRKRRRRVTTSERRSYNSSVASLRYSLLAATRRSRGPAAAVRSPPALFVRLKIRRERSALPGCSRCAVGSRNTSRRWCTRGPCPPSECYSCIRRPTVLFVCPPTTVSTCGLSLFMCCANDFETR